MNVKDLMDVLKDKDPNAIVVINSYGGRGVNEVGKASACEIWLDVSQSWYNGKHMVFW